MLPFFYIFEEPGTAVAWPSTSWSRRSSTLPPVGDRLDPLPQLVRPAPDHRLGGDDAAHGRALPQCPAGLPPGHADDASRSCSCSSREGFQRRWTLARPRPGDGARHADQGHLPDGRGRSAARRRGAGSPSLDAPRQRGTRASSRPRRCASCRSTPAARCSSTCVVVGPWYVTNWSARRSNTCARRPVGPARPKAPGPTNPLTFHAITVVHDRAWSTYHVSWVIALAGLVAIALSSSGKIRGAVASRPGQRASCLLEPAPSCSPGR